MRRRSEAGIGPVSTEARLVGILVGFLASQGYNVRLEVANLAQSADIVATRGRWVTLIEAKVSHWRRAMAQCQGHIHVADYICLALGRKKIPWACYAVAREHGFGIIGVDPVLGRCRWLLRPRRNKAVWPPERRRWAKNLRKIDYAR